LLEPVDTPGLGSAAADRHSPHSASWCDTSPVNRHQATAAADRLLRALQSHVPAVRCAATGGRWRRSRCAASHRQARRRSCWPGGRSVRPARQLRGTLGRVHARVEWLALQRAGGGAHRPTVAERVEQPAAAAASRTRRGATLRAAKGPACDSSARDADETLARCTSHMRSSLARTATRCQPRSGRRHGSQPISPVTRPQETKVGLGCPGVTGRGVL